MRHKPEHTCFGGCVGCAFDLGVQSAKKKPTESAKYVWMVVDSNNPCDIRRYAFSHAEGVAQLAHVKNYKDDRGTWRLFKLVPVNKKDATI